MPRISQEMPRISHEMPRISQLLMCISLNIHINTIFMNITYYLRLALPLSYYLRLRRVFLRLFRLLRLLRLRTFFTVAFACFATAVPTFCPRPKTLSTMRPERLNAERPTLRLASIRWCIGEYTRRNRPLDFLVLPLAISILVIEYLSNPSVQI